MYCEIKTSRLKLRPINLVDSSFMLELVNTKGWLKYIGDRKVHTVADAEQYIQRILDNPLYFYHVIEVASSNEPVGVISFLKRDSQQYYDIGFAMLPKFERRGIAFEACTAYMKAIQADQAFENLIAICLPNNEPSIALLNKLGFTYQNDFQQGEDILSIYALKNQVKYFD
jgi:ribosomal-protein-alanine N-acetyltransferase